MGKSSNQLEDLRKAHAAAASMWLAVVRLSRELIAELASSTRHTNASQGTRSVLAHLKQLVVREGAQLSKSLGFFALARGPEGFRPPQSEAFCYASAHQAVLNIARMHCDRAASLTAASSLLSLHADLDLIKWPIAQGLQYELAVATQPTSHHLRVTQARRQHPKPQASTLQSTTEWLTNAQVTKVLRYCGLPKSSGHVSNLKRRGTLVPVYTESRSTGVTRRSLALFLDQATPLRGADADEVIDQGLSHRSNMSSRSRR